MDYKEHYRIDAEEFDYWGEDQFSLTEKRRNQYTLKLANIQAGQKVLDIGSGRGWFSLLAASYNADTTAVDLSHTNLERIKQSDDRVKTLLADAINTGAEAGSYDLVVALEVLEHITNPEQALQHWASLLKPGGRLLITVPYKEKLRYELCIHCNKKTPHSAHLHSFSREKLCALIRSSGLRVVSTSLFCHKLMQFLHLDMLTHRLPYLVWRFFDAISALSGDKYNYIAVVCRRGKH
jgi:2-polyprenyl-3-methyl-5-hydroxy-6-metoxy-1,4-benzoquinol methylase